MIEKLFTMKTLKLAFVSAMIALSSSAFAGNFENCCSTEAKNENAMVSLSSSEMSAISDSNVKGMLQNMTQKVRQQVNESNIEMMLQNMTHQVQERVRTVPSNKK